MQRLLRRQFSRYPFHGATSLLNLCHVCLNVPTLGPGNRVLQCVVLCMCIRRHREHFVLLMKISLLLLLVLQCPFRVPFLSRCCSHIATYCTVAGSFSCFSLLGYYVVLLLWPGLQSHAVVHRQQSSFSWHMSKCSVLGSQEVCVSFLLSDPLGDVQAAGA